MERAFHDLKQVVEIMRDQVRHLGNGLYLMRPIARTVARCEARLRVEREAGCPAADWVIRCRKHARILNAKSVRLIARSNLYLEKTRRLFRSERAIKHF